MKYNYKYSLKELKNSKNQSFYELGKSLIPGGSQLLSKRPEMFAPNVWPSYYSKAKGCRVWDLDGREFIDMSIMGVGACILGYADDEVDDKVINAIKNGVSSSLNCPEEVKLAEKLIQLHPWFDMVRFSKSGGEAMSIAIRIARAHTGRDVILFSGYHGWSDWYLAANIGNTSNLDGQLLPGLDPAGVPRSLAGTAIPFTANNIESIRSLIHGNEKNIAAIVIEPARGEEASEDYLNDLKDLSIELDAVLIFDEITSGFRACPGGIHRKYNVHPDIAVFAKSMTNGYPLSAIVGNSKVMESAQKTFISSTNWTDSIGSVASLATIDKYIACNVDKYINSQGLKIKNIWSKYSQKYNIDIQVSGLDSLCAFNFQHPDAQKMNTVFTIEMLKMGFLGFRQFKPSYSHTDDDINSYELAVDSAFSKLSLDPACSELDTPIHHARFEYLTKE
jgi:glutamate-1-semialdehyde aminotransferase